MKRGKKIGKIIGNGKASFLIPFSSFLVPYSKLKFYKAE